MNDLWVNYEWMNDEWIMIELQFMLAMVMFIETSICESCFYHLQAFINSKGHSNKMIYTKKGAIVPNITY
jgi:hypothetical protein